MNERMILNLLGWPDCLFVTGPFSLFIISPVSFKNFEFEIENFPWKLKKKIKKNLWSHEVKNLVTLNQKTNKKMIWPESKLEILWIFFLPFLTIERIMNEDPNWYQIITSHIFP